MVGKMVPLMVAWSVEPMALRKGKMKVVWMAA